MTYDELADALKRMSRHVMGADREILEAAESGLRAMPEGERIEGWASKEAEDDGTYEFIATEEKPLLISFYGWNPAVLVVLHTREEGERDE